MREISSLIVNYHGKTVGTLAETKDGKGAFQYDKEWINDGFSISPFSLPLTEKVFVPKTDLLEGLFGVFTDSLPDGWGRLLVDRMLRSKKIFPEGVSSITRLGIVGNTGMGALEYFPELMQMNEPLNLDFDELSMECEKLLNDKECLNLDMMFQMGSSSGGARPKVLINVDDESWIVKFPSSFDRKTIGQEEFAYMKCAAKCGITVPEIRLFPSSKSKGYFGVKRFDRTKSGKIHMITVSGLLETSHRIPNLDYRDLMKLTYLLTKDERQMEEMYRRMCFNVFAHNRDDHSKNFSYLYDESENRWKLSPAYDLTYSSSIGGEHATSVNGNGKAPTLNDMMEVGKAAGLPVKKLTQVADEIKEIVESNLSDIINEYR